MKRKIEKYTHTNNDTNVELHFICAVTRFVDGTILTTESLKARHVTSILFPRISPMWSRAPYLSWILALFRHGEHLPASSISYDLAPRNGRSLFETWIDLARIVARARIDARFKLMHVEYGDMRLSMRSRVRRICCRPRKWGRTLHSRVLLLRRFYLLSMMRFCSQKSRLSA